MSVQHATLRHLNLLSLRLKDDGFDRNIWFHIGDLVKNGGKELINTILTEYSITKDEAIRLHQAGNSCKL